MADYAIDKMVKILERLLALTKQNRIQWEAADRDETFTYSTESTSITVGTRDGDGQHPYFARIHNSRGVVVDEVTTDNYDFDDSEPFGPPKRPGWHASLAELWQRARRSSSQADFVLDSFLNQLPDPDEPPF